MQVSFIAWFTVLETVITAVPGATALTVPLPSTVATDESEEFQLRALLSVVSAGSTVAVRVCVFPASSVAEFVSRVTEVIGISYTANAILPDTPPAFAVTVTSPALTPVTVTEEPLVAPSVA